MKHRLKRFHSVVASFALLATALWSLESRALTPGMEPALNFSPAFSAAAQPCSSLLQDKQGFLWLGTHNGLLRFDGSQTKRFEPGPQSLPGRAACQLFEDAQGLIWVGTDGGIAAYNPQTGRFSPLPAASKADGEWAMSGGASKIAQDRQGQLWFALQNGLIRYDKSSQAIQHFRSQPGAANSLAAPTVTAMAMDVANNLLWLVYGNRGLDQLNIATGELTHLRQSPGQYNALDTDFLRSVQQDNKGQLWLGSERSLVRMNPRKNEFKSFPIDAQASPDPHTSHWRWLANGQLVLERSTAAGRLHSFDPVSGKTRVQTYVGAPLVSALVDRQSRMWLALADGQVLASDPAGRVLQAVQSQPQKSDGLASNAVRTVFEDRRQRMWIGFADAGLNVWEPRQRSFARGGPQGRALEGLAGTPVSAFWEDEKGSFFVGTAQGLLQYPREGVALVKKHDLGGAVQQIRQDVDNPDLLWVSVRGAGLCHVHRLSGASECVEPQAAPTAPAAGRFTLDRNDTGVLWWAGARGLERFDRRKKRFEPVTWAPREGGADTAVPAWDVLQDGKSRLWLATQAGLALLERPDGALRMLGAEQGLGQWAVLQLALDDEGKLWLASREGIVQFDPDKQQVLQRFGLADGMAGLDFVPGGALRARDGQIWMASSSGLTLVNPADVASVRKRVPLYLSALRLDGQPMESELAVEQTTEIRLPAGHRSFDFEFSALDLSGNASPDFAYRLLGLEEQWTPTARYPGGRYTVLPAGEYELQVKAQATQDAGEPALRLKVVVLPHAWQTAWGQGLMALAVALLLWLVFYLGGNRRTARLAHLQHVLAVRTQELKEQRQKADEAVLSKSYFLSNISHEIRTPMNAIMGFSNLIARTPLNARQKDYVQKINLSSKHLLGILNNIIDFSKTEVGKLTVERTPFALQSVVQNVINLVADKSHEKGIELICRVEPEVPVNVLGDPMRLGQILSNLMDNALKFTEHGEIELHVSLPEDLNPAHYTVDMLLRFEVRDTGLGLSQEQIGSLFQSFSQLDASPSRRYGGTGMGLVVSKTLAELMGGEIGVDSAPGKGSVFWFTARLGWGESQPRQVVDTRFNHALVIDDNARSGAVLAAMLSDLGYVVQTEVTGAQGLARAAAMDREGAGCDLVLVDWDMPDMDGAQTVRQLAEMPLHKLPKILLLSAQPRAEVLQQALAHGADDVLRKPVSGAGLLDAIANMVQPDGGMPPGSDASADAAQDEFFESVPPQVLALAGARVLLVEDNDLNQELACELLREAGCVIDVAGNGAIALERLKHQRYDLVFMDMQMPVMDGLTATQEIRKDSQFAQLPIVAMTASAMHADRERCIAAGMNDYISKPIEPQDLWNALLRWIPPKAG